MGGTARFVDDICVGQLSYIGKSSDSVLPEIEIINFSSAFELGNTWR
jgi:hypothetical protein